MILGDKMLTRVKKHFKNNLLVYTTFLCGLIVISAIYILQDVSPYGKNSLLTVDFFHQYGPMLGELFDRIKNGSNLIYSFSMGMGLPFIRNFLNYLSSPFNIIIFLFDRNNLLTSFSFIIGLKAVMSSVTLVYFFKKKFNIKSLCFIPLALLYGFCAYFTAYYWNIMWLDGMVFLPMIVLGIENIVNENKFYLYTISLAIMLIANYFIGYMICLFSVIYFIGYLLIKEKKVKVIIKKGLIFTGASILAGGIAALFLIPLFLSIKSISATSDSWPTSQYYAFTFWEYLGNHFTGIYRTVFKSGISNAANISTGILTIALLLLFIINPKIKLKIKIFYLSLIFIFILSFFYAPFDFIWHAFHVPNDLPYRYSFIYSFVFVIIAGYSLYYLKELKIRYVSIVYFLNLIFIGLLYFLKYGNIAKQMILLNFVVLTLYFVLYLIYQNFPNIKKYTIGLFIILTMSEIIISINHNWSIFQHIDDFYSDYYKTENALEYVKLNESSKMYRIERTQILTFNDPSWYNYYGQTTFSSMAYENMAHLQNKLAMPGNKINSYYYKQNTPIYDLMFNIKYFIGDTWDIKRYELYYNEDDVIVFKNKYNAGLMFAINNDIKSWNYNSDDPLFIQKDFMEKASSIPESLVKLVPNKIEKVYDHAKKVIKYTYKNVKDNMYFYINSPDIDFIIVNDTMYFMEDFIDYYKEASEDIEVFDYISFGEKYIINTRTEDKEYSIYVGYNNYTKDSFYGYTINNTNFEQAANMLVNNSVNITDFTENYIKGNITLEKDSVLYTSIPYDEGWKVKVNGEEIETYKIGNALLAFDIKSGENTIELKFKSKGIVVGSIISAVSLITFIALSSRKIKKTKS